MELAAEDEHPPQEVGSHSLLLCSAVKADRYLKWAVDIRCAGFLGQGWTHVHEVAFLVVLVS